jgi:hypothetical protein
LKGLNEFRVDLDLIRLVYPQFHIGLDFFNKLNRDLVQLLLLLKLAFYLFLSGFKGLLAYLNRCGFVFQKLVVEKTISEGGLQSSLAHRVQVFCSLVKGLVMESFRFLEDRRGCVPVFIFSHILGIVGYYSQEKDPTLVAFVLSGQDLFFDNRDHTLTFFVS